MWDAVIRFLRFLNRMYATQWFVAVWWFRAMVFVIAAVLIWLLMTGRLIGQ